MKIIFLDIDGVLNNSSTKELCGKYTGIENNCLARLKNVIDITKAKIVLISTWKEFWVKSKKLKYLQDDLANYLDKKFAEKNLTIYDKVENELNGEELTRGEGIVEYIKRTKPQKFVIVDDMEFDYAECGLKKFFVRTHGTLGLLECNTGRIIRMLLDKID